MVRRLGIRDPMRLGELLRSIDGYTGREVVAIALQLAPLFFVRPGELRQARWRQVDVPDALWHIPAECMKIKSPALGAAISPGSATVEAPARSFRK
jgi:integrase